MKILHFATAYFPRYGGIPCALREIFHHTSGEHTLICRSAYRTGVSEAFVPAGEDLSDPRVRVIRTKGADVFTAETLNLIKRLDYDVFVAHTAYPEIVKGLRHAKGRRISFTRGPVTVLPEADDWITISEEFKKSLVRAGAPEGKVRVIPPSVDLGVFRPSVQTPKSAIYVGRIAPEKRVQELVDNFPLDWDLTLLGDYDHPERDRLRASRPFHHALAKSPLEVARALATREVCVSATRGETFCQVFAQAFACGVPVVSTFTPPWARGFVREVEIGDFASGLGDLRPPMDMEWLSWDKWKGGFWDENTSRL